MSIDPFVAANQSGAAQRPADGALRSVLPSASDEALRFLDGSGAQRAVGRRAPILEPGDTSQVVLVLDGLAAVEQDGPEGQRAMLAVVRPPRLLGLSRIDGGYTSNRIVALAPCSLRTWTRDEFAGLLRSDLGAANDVARTLAASLAFVFERIELLAFTTAQTRVAVVLLEHEELWFGSHGVAQSPLERRDLAALATTSREMVGRIVRGWERDGVLRRAGRHRLELGDRAALERIARRRYAGGEPPSETAERPGE